MLILAGLGDREGGPGFSGGQRLSRYATTFSGRRQESSPMYEPRLAARHESNRDYASTSLTDRHCSPSLSEAEGSVLSLSKGSLRLLGPLAEGGDPAVGGEPGEGVPAGYFGIELAAPGDGIIRHPVGTGQPSTCGSVPDPDEPHAKCASVNPQW